MKILQVVALPLKTLLKFHFADNFPVEFGMTSGHEMDNMTGNRKKDEMRCSSFFMSQSRRSRYNLSNWRISAKPVNISLGGQTALAGVCSIFEGGSSSLLTEVVTSLIIRLFFGLPRNPSDFKNMDLRKRKLQIIFEI